ncbi:MAG: tetratricopeptide repeat protein, partial [Ktedonobacteraceae bacterium]
MPLALDQAGAYIEASGCSLSDYLRLLQASQGRLLAEREAHAAHPFSVSKTLTLAFEHLAQSNALAAELLTACAFLAPEAIPETFFLEGAVHLGPAFEALAADPLQFHAAIKALLSYSLLQRNATAHTLTVHRLVQAVLKGRLSEAEQDTWVARVVRAINHVFPVSDALAGYWQNCDKLLPHALASINLGKQWQEHLAEERMALMNHAASYLVKRTQFSEAEQLFYQVWSHGEHAMGAEHLLIAEAVQGLAEISFIQGKYQEAEVFLQRALHMWEKLLGPEHRRVGADLVNLGAIYAEQENY